MNRTIIVLKYCEIQYCYQEEFILPYPKIIEMRYAYIYLNNSSMPLSFCSGGLRLKRDITEYGDFVRSFNAPTVDEKFESLSM